jgi:antitoxin component of RelBE/YafQ-DinJ toxin-antitoxin module
MNFRIPRDLKDRFQTKCRMNRTPMTSELTRMIQTYVIQDLRIPMPSSTPRQEQVTTKSRTITYRDPDTGLLVTTDGLWRSSS